ncbi:unnamed protein product [Calicophoron daubneyi]|uniref:Glucosamine 6-phosphate N-acetyltransferase n=1 Tax=Calicophoron daubneyi TaxID=300641 RepID=A0AAV2U021_CALDB
MPCDGFGDTYLFNPKLLEAISINQIIQSNLTQKCPDFSESGCCVRPLKSGDFGYLNLLQELTEVGSVTQEEFEERFNRMAACPNTYFIILIEHKSTKQVLAAATLVAELKFIHECSKRGHIEDVVVRSNCRGKNFGKLLVEILVAIGKHQGCYKISLDCEDAKVGFYEKIGFQRKNNIMYIRFDEK